MPQHLTYQEVIQAARKAYDDGTLLAVAMERGKVSQNTCVYLDKSSGCRCIIGAALTPDTLDAIQKANVNSQMIPSLVYHKIVSLEKEECAKIEMLQLAHDEWMCGSEYGKAASLEAMGVSA